MINIVKRLRDLGDQAAYEPHIHHAAADQIEALDADVERLRAALDGLLGCPAIADENYTDPSWGCAETAAAVTAGRAALGSKGDD